MPDPVLLWRLAAARSGAHDIHCTMEQLGEGVLELRLRSRGRSLLCESFTDSGELLRRAEQLWIELAPETG